MKQHKGVGKCQSTSQWHPLLEVKVSLMGCFTEAGHSLLNVKHACEKEGNGGMEGSRVKHMDDEGRSV